jgi:glycosidase
MTNILMFWASKGIDAFRCDMAEMVPDAFWCWATDKVKFAYPDIQFIGEVYDPAQYRNYIRAGFDYLYDKVGMYDCVRDVMCGRRPAGDITRQWQANDDIFGHMLYFLENHDEQRIASEFFAGDAQKGVPGMMVSALLNTNPVMVYTGQEFGEKGMDEEGFSGRDGRTTIFDYWTVDTLRRGFFERRTLKKSEREWQRLYTRILTAANEEVAIREGKLYDLMYVNPQMAGKQFAFLRKADDQLVVVVANFDERRVEVDLNIPAHAFEYLQFNPGDYQADELLTDSRQRLAITHEQPLRLDVPPCGGLVLRVKL